MSGGVGEEGKGKEKRKKKKKLKCRVDNMDGHISAGLITPCGALGLWMLSGEQPNSQIMIELQRESKQFPAINTSHSCLPCARTTHTWSLWQMLHTPWFVTMPDASTQLNSTGARTSPPPHTDTHLHIPIT